jgi:hypothetical protein
MSNVFENAEIYRIELVSQPIQRSQFRFFQKVFSQAEGWCYYSTVGGTNSNPASSETSPQHQNDISGHSLIGIVAIK